MSAVQNFKNASTLKKSLVIAFLATNVMTAIDSVAIGNVMANSIADMADETGGVLEGRPRQTKLSLLAVAPIMGGFHWISAPGTPGEKSKLEASWPVLPLSSLSKLSHHVLPEKAHLAFGITLNATGAPGAWVGMGAGIVITDIKRSLTP